MQGNGGYFLQYSYVGLLVETRVLYTPRDIWAISETGVILIDFSFTSAEVFAWLIGYVNCNGNSNWQ